MDVFAHILWTSAAARAGNVALEKKHKRRMSIAWTAFWGVFPDLFAFGITFVAMIPAILRGGFVFEHHRISGLPAELYNYSHSLVLWAVVFLITWAIMKRIPFPLFGWALHILIDIPSHGNGFFLTPFLFPLSDYRFTHGIPWSNMWYMIINYTALLSVFSYLLVHDWKARRKEREHKRYISST